MNINICLSEWRWFAKIHVLASSKHLVYNVHFFITTEISISLAKCQIRLLSSIRWRIELVFIWCALIFTWHPIKLHLVNMTEVSRLTMKWTTMISYMNNIILFNILGILQAILISPNRKTSVRCHEKRAITIISRKWSMRVSKSEAWVEKMPKFFFCHAVH